MSHLVDNILFILVIFFWYRQIKLTKYVIKENENLRKEALIPLGEASKQATLLVSYCQGDFNDDGILERKELNRDKLDQDAFNLLLAVKKVEFQVQDLLSKKGK